MKQNRSLLALVVLFGILLAIALVQNQILSERANLSVSIPDPSPANDANLSQRIFTDFEAADIVAFQVLDPLTQASMSFSRMGENFWESLEFGVDLNQQIANQLAYTVAILPYRSTIQQVAVDQYPQYGLTVQDAFLLLSILLEDNTQHAVLVGDVTPDRAGHYALVDDRSDVYVLDARPIAFLTIFLRQLYEIPTTETPGRTP